MEVIEQGEQLEFVDGKFVFLYTLVILRKEGDYFHARYDSRMLPPAQINPNLLEIHPIPAAHLWPLYSNDITLAPNPLPPDTYIKRPRMIQYTEDCTSRIPDLFLAEARTCETLRKAPHPNIARYLGCLVKDNRITGLCFENYDMTLEDRLKDHSRPLPHDILKGVKSGIQHLHNLGLAHNDINPRNIMFKAGDDTPVIIDFDSCGKEGDKLLKGGTMSWTDGSIDIATAQNDYYGLKKIEEIMASRDASDSHI
jgi:serine/threonine protein kinase